MISTLVTRLRSGHPLRVSSVALRARCGEHGATAVEYGLMVGLIAVVIIVGVTAFGQGVDALFTIPAGVFGGP
ncbi:Flp family type IVb pilin [Phycicoccus sp. SLBN-51]|uniref:Flp family type IVb pilin n=1 Tax=Phycicoccus sp. SLBN-51 TaxID=2768447 RepID=UPI00116BBD4A|nr:Flp family type IVb pilin [Phycicoccus sp. SLBN-51]TQJ51680.1 Flp pilus assembly pilin Flp [Phycicoccus sp. SLBN-51]